MEIKCDEAERILREIKDIRNCGKIEVDYSNERIPAKINFGGVEIDAYFEKFCYVPTLMKDGRAGIVEQYVFMGTKVGVKYE